MSEPIITVDGVPAFAPEAPPKRRRGRPPGSKNKNPIVRKASVFDRRMTAEELDIALADLGQDAVRALGDMLREDADRYEPEVRLKAIGLGLEYAVAKPAKKLGVADRGDLFAEWMGTLMPDHDADPGDAS